MASKSIAFTIFSVALAGGLMLADTAWAAPPSPPANPVLIYINRAFGIEVSNADGAAKTELIAKSSLTRPSWAPAAGGAGYPRHVVYESPICQLKQLDVVLDDAGKPKAINILPLPMPSDVSGACAPEISPVGDRLVFGEGNVETGQISSLWTMEADANGGGEIEVYPAPSGSVITWSTYNNDGTQIAFVENGPNGQDSIKPAFAG